MTEFQQVILNIYKETAAICRKNDIPFFGIGGSCLGAVRHKGFIPWDDDMDIAVPVEDFDRFLECARRELPERYQVVTCLDKRPYHALVVKIEDTETAFMEVSELPYPESYKGIVLDVMPFAGVPEGGFARSLYTFRIRAYYVLNKVMRYPRSRMANTKEKLLWPLLAPLRAVAGDTYISKKWNRLVRTQPMRKAETVGFVWSRNIKKRLFKRSWFDTFVELPFEDTTLPCPAGYDAYLSVHYGDYMKLPPSDKQVSHHPGLLDPHNSYKDYQSGRLPV